MHLYTIYIYIYICIRLYTLNSPFLPPCWARAKVILRARRTDDMVPQCQCFTRRGKVATAWHDLQEVRQTTMVAPNITWMCNRQAAIVSWRLVNLGITPVCEKTSGTGACHTFFCCYGLEWKTMGSHIQSVKLNY
jgi:hypothetical protein